MTKYDAIITQVKNLENKPSDKTIDNILNNINNTIFSINKAYLTPNITNYALNTIKEYAIQLKNYSPTNITYNKRKEEILNKTRTIFKNLSNLNYTNENINNNIIANQKFQLYKYLQQIKNNNNIIEQLNFLSIQSIYMNEDNNHQPYLKMINELKNILIQKINNIPVFSN